VIGEIYIILFSLVLNIFHSIVTSEESDCMTALGDAAFVMGYSEGGKFW
jgi:hypothetical protein